MHTGWGNSWLQARTRQGIYGRVNTWANSPNERYLSGVSPVITDTYKGMQTLCAPKFSKLLPQVGLALHAVGDAALDFALDILEEAQERYGKPLVPNRVEHGVVVRTKHFARRCRAEYHLYLSNRASSTTLVKVYVSPSEKPEPNCPFLLVVNLN